MSVTVIDEASAVAYEFASEADADAWGLGRPGAQPVSQRPATADELALVGQATLG